MKICKKCGMNVESGAKFCPACGKAFDNENRRAGCRFDNVDIQKNKVMAVLAYLGFLVLIPIFAAKDSRFARYHAKQGLILLITEVIFYMAYGMLRFAVLSISWHLYFLVKIAGMIGYLFPVLAVTGIVNAVRGKARKLPVIGNVL